MLSKFIIYYTYIHPPKLCFTIFAENISDHVPSSELYRTTKIVNIKLHQFQEKRKVTYISTRQLCTLTFT